MRNKKTESVSSHLRERDMNFLYMHEAGRGGRPAARLYLPSPDVPAGPLARCGKGPRPRIDDMQPAARERSNVDEEAQMGVVGMVDVEWS